MAIAHHKLRMSKELLKLEVSCRKISQYRERLWRRSRSRLDDSRRHPIRDFARSDIFRRSYARSPSIAATLATDLEANNRAAPVPSSQIEGMIRLSGTMTSIQKYSQIAICTAVTSAKNCSDSFLPSLSWLYSCMRECIRIDERSPLKAAKLLRGCDLCKIQLRSGCL